MKEEAGLDIRTTVRGRLPSVPYEDILRRALPGYTLSLVICGDALATRMNREYRKKTYSPNVLSFPLSKREGEIFLNVRKAEREALRYGTTTRARMAFLFIHGILHLRGYHHGRTMERAERALMRAFHLA